jgi:hypothetical protein
MHEKKKKKEKKTHKNRERERGGGKPDNNSHSFSVLITTEGAAEEEEEEEEEEAAAGGGRGGARRGNLPCRWKRSMPLGKVDTERNCLLCTITGSLPGHLNSASKNRAVSGKRAVETKQTNGMNGKYSSRVEKMQAAVFVASGVIWHQDTKSVMFRQNGLQTFLGPMGFASLRNR